jgi:hypothetical protein
MFSDMLNIPAMNVGHILYGRREVVLKEQGRDKVVLSNALQESERRSDRFRHFYSA